MAGMKTITKIIPQKRPGRVSLFLDGEFFCGIPQSLLSKLDLFQGKVVDEKEISLLVETKLIEEAKQRIIRLLNRRMYSEKEVIAKLEAKGYEEPIIAAVVRELKATSLIDDDAFARAFVSDRLRLKPQGSFRIAYELRKRGVSETLIESIFSEEKVVQGDLQRALDMGKRRLQSLAGTGERKTKERRLYHFLLRRGFSFEVIREVIDRLFKKGLDTDSKPH